MNLADYGKEHRNRPHGTEDGSVKQIGKTVKKWEGTYHVWVEGIRQTRRRVIGLCAQMTKTEARDEHRAFIRRLKSQPIATTSKATVAQLLDDYYEIKAGDWEEHTRETNRSIFNCGIKPLIGDRAVDSVTPEDVKRFINALAQRTSTPKTVYLHRNGEKKVVYGKKKRKGASHSYVKQVIAHIRAIFDLAVERDLIRKNPAKSKTIALTIPKAIRPVDKSVFPPTQLPALLAQLSAADSLIVWISIFGTRPNELFAASGADVGPNYIRIRRALTRKRKFKDPKTQSSIRYFGLPPVLAGEVREWVRSNGIGPDDLLFPNRDGNAMDRATFLKWKLRPAARRAGIATSNVDFRMLRRSFATIANAFGLDVKSIQSQMGHAQPNMTLGVYAQPVDDLRMQELTQLELMLRGKIAMPVDLEARLGPSKIQ